MRNQNSERNPSARAGGNSAFTGESHQSRSRVISPPPPRGRRRAPSSDASRFPPSRIPHAADTYRPSDGHRTYTSGSHGAPDLYRPRDQASIASHKPSGSDLYSSYFEPEPRRKPRVSHGVRENKPSGSSTSLPRRISPHRIAPSLERKSSQVSALPEGSGSLSNGDSDPRSVYFSNLSWRRDRAPQFQPDASSSKADTGRGQPNSVSHDVGAVDKAGTSQAMRTKANVEINGVKAVPNGPAYWRYPPVALSMKLLPHFFIPASSLPADPAAKPELNDMFKKYSAKSIHMDDSGYFVIFEQNALGRLALSTCVREQKNKQAVILGQLRSLDLQPSEGRKSELEESAELVPQDDFTIKGRAMYKIDPLGSGHPRIVKPFNTNKTAEVVSASNERMADTASTHAVQHKEEPPPESRPLSQAQVPKRQEKDDTASSISEWTTSDISSSSAKVCHVCKTVKKFDSMIRCTTCPRRYHRYCQPSQSPFGSTWQCRRCIAKKVPLEEGEARTAVQAPALTARPTAVGQDYISSDALDQSGDQQERPTRVAGQRNVTREQQTQTGQPNTTASAQHSWTAAANSDADAGGSLGLTSKEATFPRPLPQETDMKLTPDDQIYDSIDWRRTKAAGCRLYEGPWHELIAHSGIWKRGWPVSIGYIPDQYTTEVLGWLCKKCYEVCPIGLNWESSKDPEQTYGHRCWDDDATVEKSAKPRQRDKHIQTDKSDTALLSESEHAPPSQIVERPEGSGLLAALMVAMRSAQRRSNDNSASNRGAPLDTPSTAARRPTSFFTVKGSGKPARLPTATLDQASSTAARRSSTIRSMKTPRNPSDPASSPMAIHTDRNISQPEPKDQATEADDLVEKSFAITEPAPKAPPSNAAENEPAKATGLKWKFTRKKTLQAGVDLAKSASATEARLNNESTGLAQDVTGHKEVTDLDSNEAERTQAGLSAPGSMRQQSIAVDTTQHNDHDRDDSAQLASSVPESDRYPISLDAVAEDISPSEPRSREASETTSMSRASSTAPRIIPREKRSGRQTVTCEKCGKATPRRPAGKPLCVSCNAEHRSRAEMQAQANQEQANRGQTSQEQRDQEQFGPEQLDRKELDREHLEEEQSDEQRSQDRSIQSSPPTSPRIAEPAANQAPLNAARIEQGEADSAEGKPNTPRRSTENEGTGSWKTSEEPGQPLALFSDHGSNEESPPSESSGPDIIQADIDFQSEGNGMLSSKRKREARSQDSSREPSPLPKKRQVQRTSYRCDAKDEFDLGTWETRPKKTYQRLIGMALCDAPKYRLQPEDIVQWVSRNIPNYSSAKFGKWAEGLKSTLILNCQGRSGEIICRRISWRHGDGGSPGKDWYELMPGLEDRIEHWDHQLGRPAFPAGVQTTLPMKAGHDSGSLAAKHIDLEMMDVDDMGQDSVRNAPIAPDQSSDDEPLLMSRLRQVPPTAGSESTAATSNERSAAVTGSTVGSEVESTNQERLKMPTCWVRSQNEATNMSLLRETRQESLFDFVREEVMQISESNKSFFESWPNWKSNPRSAPLHVAQARRSRKQLSGQYPRMSRSHAVNVRRVEPPVIPPQDCEVTGDEVLCSSVAQFFGLQDSGDTVPVSHKGKLAFAQVAHAGSRTRAVRLCTSI